MSSLQGQLQHTFWDRVRHARVRIVGPCEREDSRSYGQGLKRIGTGSRCPCRPTSTELGPNVLEG